MDENKGKRRAKDYYDQEAAEYIKQYQEGYDQYPANLIRIKFIIKRLKENKVQTVLDAGCGTCGPMIKLLKEGFNVRGFDFSKDMVLLGKKELKKSGYDPGLIHFADLEKGSGYPQGKFDAILALGVFPHVVNEKKALSNLRKLLNPKGRVFIEFRNDLFAAYTLNQYSLDFFLNRVINIDLLPRKIRADVADFYSKRLQIAATPKRKNGKISTENILTKFRNPLTLKKELFDPCDFSINDIHFYHYHALPPIFEKRFPKLFGELSLKMEKTDDWKGYLMASAYVVEAEKKDSF